MLKNINLKYPYTISIGGSSCSLGLSFFWTLVQVNFIPKECLINRSLVLLIWHSVKRKSFRTSNIYLFLRSRCLRSSGENATQADRNYTRREGRCRLSSIDDRHLKTTEQERRQDIKTSDPRKLFCTLHISFFFQITFFNDIFPKQLNLYLNFILGVRMAHLHSKW